MDWGSIVTAVVAAALSAGATHLVERRSARRAAIREARETLAAVIADFRKTPGVTLHAVLTCAEAGSDEENLFLHLLPNWERFRTAYGVLLHTVKDAETLCSLEELFDEFRWAPTWTDRDESIGALGKLRDFLVAL